MKKYIYIVLAVIVIGLIAGKLTIWKSANNSAGQLIRVVRMDLAQEVEVTGKVKTSKDLSLAFTKGGRIASVSVAVGDRVSAGDVLATLDQTDILAQIKQAQASEAVEQSKLDSLKAGTRPEEIAIQEARVASAQSAANDATENLRDKINGAFTTADDAVHTKADQMISSPRGNSPQLSFTADNQTSSDALSLRVAVEPILNSWNANLPVAGESNESLLLKADIEKIDLAKISAFLDKLALALNQATQSGSVAATTLSGWKTDVSTARTNIQTAISGLSTAQEKLRTALSTLDVEKRTLALDKAGSTPNDIAEQESSLTQASAKVTQLQSSLADTVMRAPASGIVSTVDAKTGEIAPANTGLVRIVSSNAYDIEVNIPETDIGSVSLGNEVVITLDAFPGETFTGKVVLIDPAETIVDGVVNFKTTVRLDKLDPRVKSGMTANLRIQTLVKKQVLALPQYAIIENDQGKFVRVKDEAQKLGYREIPITTGIRNPQGLVEVLTGVSEGDNVMNIGIK